MDSIIKSRIDGEFDGFDNNRVYKLENGQEWKQDCNGHSFRFSFNPRATIARENGRYVLEVEGMSNKVEVRQVA